MSFELIAGKRSRSPSPSESSFSSFCLKTGGDTDSEEDQSDESEPYVPKDDVSFEASTGVDVLEVAECDDDCNIFSIFEDHTLGVALTEPTDRSSGRTTRDKAAGGGTASAIFYGKTREGDDDVVVKVAQICDRKNSPFESCDDHPKPTAFDLDIKRWHTMEEFLNEGRVHDMAAAKCIHPKIFKKIILKVNKDVYGVTVMQRLGETLHSRLKKLGMHEECQYRDTEALKRLALEVYNLLEKTVREARVLHEDLHTGNVLFGVHNKLQLIDFGKQAREISDYEESDVEKHVSSMMKVMIDLDISHCYDDSETKAEVQNFIDNRQGKKNAKNMLQTLFTKCCLREKPEWMV